jgi:hypothetical protein
MVDEQTETSGEDILRIALAVMAPCLSANEGAAQWRAKVAQSLSSANCCERGRCASDFWWRRFA